MKKIFSLFLPAIKIIYLIGVTAILYLALSHRVYDDPFITYRYAENIRNGVGFVYNPGERVLSTTTPLFALILAFLGNFWSDLPHLSNLIGAISIALGGWFLWELGQTWKSPLVGWSGLLLYPTFPLLLSTLGSETPLFLAWVLGAFLLYARKQIGPAVFLLALATLTRTDGALVAVMLGIHYLWINRDQLRQATFWRRQPWGWLGISLGLLLLWHGFAWIYFGSPLPVTLAAKQAQGRMAISRLFAPSILRITGWYAGVWQYWAELILAPLGIVFAIWKKKIWLLILGWAALYFAAYTLLRVTGYFWYYAPLVPGWVVAVGLGLSLFYWIPLPGQLRTSLSAGRIRFGLVAALLAVLFLGQLFHSKKMIDLNDTRYPIYRAVGQWLSENTPMDASVGTLEVGMIGYFSQRPMVDFAGLIQPAVADQMQTDTTYDDTALWAVQTYQPEYLALIDGAHPRLQTEFVAAHCQPIKRFAAEEYDFRTDMHVYACQYP